MCVRADALTGGGGGWSYFSSNSRAVSLPRSVAHVRAELRAKGVDASVAEKAVAEHYSEERACRELVARHARRGGGGGGGDLERLLASKARAHTCVRVWYVCPRSCRRIVPINHPSMFFLSVH